MHFAMNLKGNTKTAIPTTTSAKDTCPDSCPLKVKGCYAKNHFLGKYWERLSNGEVKTSLDFQGLVHAVKRLPKGQLWRHNQAGDLCHNEGKISYSRLNALVSANKGKNGFTYTHHELTQENTNLLKFANDNGFTVNASSNNVAQADEYLAKGLPVVTLLEVDAPNVSYTPKGSRVVACPAEKSKKVTCATCGLCAEKDRAYVIGFRAHGSAKKTVDLIAKG